ncbi:MAG: hypothetical protein ABJZ55_09035 [Fuerstiella sp.]
MNHNMVWFKRRSMSVDGANNLNSPAFCVVLHDVAGPFRIQIQHIVRQVFGLVGNRFACALVPAWHGHCDDAALAELISICGGCDEWLVHGMTHRRESDGHGGQSGTSRGTSRGFSPGYGGRLVSWLTNGADEFGGLPLIQIQERVTRSQFIIRDLTGRLPTGLVAPCWSLPVRSNELKGIDYVMGYNGLVPCCRSENDQPEATVRIASWSYDWGRFGKVASLVNLFPEVRFRSLTDIVPCVVIHPADVGRGWLPVAIRKIQKLLDLGYRPVVPASLMSARQASIL